ncbi:membrane hypothetical protein [[Clostridium] ultunense Esp]|uniref:Uncharacterized protein n=1 Tax=[Clostridium] ultunense Esp TaxID=1288971 RepID=M1Z7X5_9FIRM|nr:hypothetical protein [Schnuerera ultunensis]CCQ93658.1 membrane hypothetical protein [[Clostridium] ultunense Esp]SHD78111.1 conserved membrane protein of unknown function [[Clostridium] ultunense Esp]
MQAYIDLILFGLVVILLLIFLRWRKKKLALIKTLPEVNYPFKAFNFGTVFYSMLILVLIISFLMVYIFEKDMPYSIVLIFIFLWIVYLMFGATPTINENKYKIQITVDTVGGRLKGFDFLNTWMGKYQNGIIVYYYPINMNSISAIEENEEEIFFRGSSISSKFGELPIEVRLRSKLSKNYFKEFIQESMPYHQLKL